MNIHKSHSKNDLIDFINLLHIPIKFSHQDNKKVIQMKLKDILKTHFKIKDNYHTISDKGGIVEFLTKQNPKKSLTIKQKNDVMSIAKYIINYCKNDYDIELSPKYNTLQEIHDDMDYIKQFGDIPSVRRCCRLLKDDPQFNTIKFNPVVSPQIQKIINDKKICKSYNGILLKVKHGTPENPILVTFD
tara:strand:+ start:1456 stop:2019 length:564 start_codon:yes stop_codon:yes gene_type:complete